MLNIREITVAVLLLTAIICNAQDVSNESNISFDVSDSSFELEGINAQGRIVNIAALFSSTSTAMNTVFDRMKLELKNLSTNLNTAFTTLSNTASSFVKSLLSTILNRGEQVDTEIANLQQQFGGAEYAKCFTLTGTVSTIANGYVDGATKCVENIINQAQNTFNTISSNVVQLVNAVDTINNAGAGCKNSFMGEWACTMSTTASTAVSMAAATTNITVTATKATLYFSTLMPELLKCSTFQTNFLSVAFDSVRKVTACINGVMNPGK